MRLVAHGNLIHTITIFTLESRLVHTYSPTDYKLHFDFDVLVSLLAKATSGVPEIKVGASAAL